MKNSPAPTTDAGAGAAKFLSQMPSRGNFSSGSVASSLGGLRIYVCEHSTDPLEGQVIKTDSTNILIRHLQLNKQKNEAKDSGCRTPVESSRGKRFAARSLDINNLAKRPNMGTSSGSSVDGKVPLPLNPHSLPILYSSEEAISGFSQHTLQSFTVDTLRGLLRQSGLSLNQREKG